MDQNTMVGVNLAGGSRLIDLLCGRGFAIHAAFWARLSDEERWILYLESPYVDQHGFGESYRLIHSILRDAPEWGLDPFTVTVLGVGNPMAKAAADLVKPKVAVGSFAVPNPKPYRGITRFDGGSLGGIPVDGAFIYPPWEPEINPVA
jgi:hypothetical protein